MSSPIRTVAELDAALPLPSSSSLELWVELEDGQAMSALTNGSVGWLMYLRFKGDSGLSSRNPSYSGDSAAVINYRLTNGQVDSYPASWAYSIEKVKLALRAFLETGQPPGWIQWHED
jgi:Immunity protein Imm1